MIDLSAVQAQDDDDYIRLLVNCAKKYCCVAVISMPSRVALTKELIGEDSGILLGGAIGFPSGGQATSAKVFETQELL